jgi:hypothetical protein
MKIEVSIVTIESTVMIEGYTLRTEGSAARIEVCRELQ